MDAYFASVEQRDIPLYKDKPLLVCHTDDIRSNRGVVATSSYEARPFGVKSGMSVLEAKNRLPKGVYVKGNYEKYLYNTKRIVEACSKYSDQLEIYSVDELFVDVTNTAHLFGGPLEVAKGITGDIRRTLDLPCSAGIGPNKLIAKMASDMQKPMGITLIEQDQLPGIIADLPIGDLVGIGRRMEGHLNNLGIKVLGDIVEFGPTKMKYYFGQPGLALWYAAQGIDHSPLELGDNAENQIKSFGHSSSLSGKGETNMYLLAKLLLGLTDAVTRRMRKKQFVGRRVAIRMRMGRLFGMSRSRTLPYYCDSTGRLFEVAASLLLNEADLVKKYGCTNIGVSVSRLLQESDCFQPTLFDSLETREKKLASATDLIKDRYGDNAIVRCSLLGWNKEYQAVPQIELKRFSGVPQF